jgi:hypothetical protein
MEPGAREQAQVHLIHRYPLSGAGFEVSKERLIDAWDLKKPGHQQQQGKAQPQRQKEHEGHRAGGRPVSVAKYACSHHRQREP